MNGRRSGFRLWKLYADLVTDDGTVCIAYQAQVEFLRRCHSYGAVEIYWPDGRREVLRATQSTFPAYPANIDEARPLHFNVPGGPFILEHDVISGSWAPRPPAQRINWFAKTVRAHARGRWLNDRSRPELRGLGYIDFVQLDLLPRRLGIRTLEWGRAHTPSESLVFNAIEFRSGLEWKRALCWSPEEEPIEWDEFALDRRADNLRLHLPATASTPARHFDLQLQSELHAGGPLDSDRFPGLLERLVSRALAGPIAEARWISRARTADKANPASGWALHELVRFGIHEAHPYHLPIEDGAHR